MQRFFVLVAALAVPALAQTPPATTTTTTTPTTPTSPTAPNNAPASTLTGLPRLVAQLPLCAIPCFNTGAQAVNCAVTDLACMCRGSNLASLSTSVATCLSSNTTRPRPTGPDDDDDCELDDLNDLAQLSAGICVAVGANPPQSQLDQASSIMNSKLAQAGTPTSAGSGAGGASPTTTGTGTGSQGTGSPNAAGRGGGLAQGVLVMAAAYAFAAF